MVSEKVLNISDTWEPVKEEFLKWLGHRENLLDPCIPPEPTGKCLVFLALLDSDRYCTYEDIQEIISRKNVIRGNIPNVTLRTSVASLGKTLDKFRHPLELKSLRGHFKLEKRPPDFSKKKERADKKNSGIIVLMDDIVTEESQEEEIARTIIKKTTIPFKALFLLEWSARMWEHYSSEETEMRFPQEFNAWYNLGIKERLSKDGAIKECVNVVGLAVGEGLSEIGVLKTITEDKDISKIHYLAVESSPRLLRDHIGLIKESFFNEIASGRLLCAGVLSDMFYDLNEPVERARKAFLSMGVTNSSEEFLPKDSGLLITYFGNCLGNNAPDKETEIFALIRSSFRHRPLEFLVGTAVIHSDIPEQYKRNWDDFLIQMPKYLMETRGLLVSSSNCNSTDREFLLTKNGKKKERFPDVILDPYIAQHGIKGKIYRFYYKLSHDLCISEKLDDSIPSLPRGTQILLMNVIKYDMRTLIQAVENGMSFKVSYNDKFNAVLKTQNGEREYATFSAYLEE